METGETADLADQLTTFWRDRE